MSKKIALIGFGNQAKAWALNLRDSGYQVSIILRPASLSIEVAKNLGFTVISPKPELKNHLLFAMLTPDHTHLETLNSLKDFLAPQSKIIYAHGFSYSEHKLKEKFPKFSHLLLAPKTIASELRFHYQTKDSISGVMSTEGSLSPTEDKILLENLSQALGFTMGPFEVSFQEETTADLFSEQALLCGLYPFVMNLAFNQLVQSGHSKPLSFLECWHESKLIMNTLITKGPEKFFSMISPNAFMGAVRAQKLLLDDEFKNKLQKLLSDIENKKFSDYLQNADYEKEKKAMLEFWKNQPLTKTYNDMKSLYEK